MFRTSRAAVRGHGDDIERTWWLLHRHAGGATKGVVGFSRLQSGAETTLHRHPNAEEALMVLDGEGVALTLAGEEPLARGSVLFAPRGAWHGARAGAAPMLFLIVYGGVAAPDEAEREAIDGSTAGDAPPAVVSRAGNARFQTLHSPERGFLNMQSVLRVAEDIGRSECIVLGESNFDGAASAHELHRHPAAEEFQLVLEGEGFHVGEGGVETRIGPGEMTLLRAGEWHGFRGGGNSVTRTVFGFLGAPGLKQAGYELPT